MLTRALFFLIAVAAVLVSVSSAPSCGTTCHTLAYCEGDESESYCTCQPGTIDVSDNEDGTDCSKEGYTVRFVGAFDLTPLDISTTSEVATLSADVASSYFCASDAEGYFARSVRLGMGRQPHNSSVPSVIEINCLYRNMPESINAEYAAVLDRLGTVRVQPAVYRWVLPTTDAPMEIPPTGLEVESVHFEPSCAESGCWVIKGTMTTGEAFNTFNVFNTFFLPQADITDIQPQGILSYDYDYSAVEWTFAPANHPCTSAGYQAGISGIEKVSTCCIDYPGASAPGFVPNYRPTEAFVKWSDDLGCHERFTDEDGQDTCWRVYRQDTWWTTAELRCKAAGGHLASIGNEDENARFRAMLNKKGHKSAWIGLRDTYDAETPRQYVADFQWTDESTKTYRNWGVDQPVPPECFELGGAEYNYNGIDNETGDYYSVSWVWCMEKDYVYMEENGTWAADNQFGASDQSELKMAYVCEFEPPAECIPHVLSRPNYAAPEPDPALCWEAHPNEFKSSWSDAQAVCNASGGHLVTLDDVEDHFLLWRIMQHPDVNMELSWMGFTDAVTEGEWRWVDQGINSEDEDGYWYEYDYYTYWLYVRINTQQFIEFYGYYYDYYDADEPNQERDCAYFWREPALWMQDKCSGSHPYPFVCEVPRDRAQTCHSDLVTGTDGPWDVAFPIQYHNFLDVGKFKGLEASPGVTNLTNLDPFFGQFAFEIKLDEVELRSRAGILRGTVGVEHTVDTYLGLANFRPTGTAVLDTFATQTNLHLEKTSFFSVSTHGVNDYTFLEYVNMRLVSILDEDTDFSGNNAERTERSSRAGNAAYVQVTFTLGEQYQPNDAASGGLIPTDSVRAGLGTFFADVEADGDMEHVCSSYAAATTPPTADPTSAVGLSDFSGEVQEFNRLVGQDCGPASVMCKNPSSLPDQFVSYNIPLGFEVFDGQASSSLSANIFVSLVVNAVDTVAPTANMGNPTAPNAGGDPFQMKTTLTASIPIVAGGVNIFCDGFTAKTDLADVANVDIVVGSASSSDELTRLRILEDVASTDLSPKTASVIDTDSIESALMTLVLKGNHSYFAAGPGRNTGDYAMELDDLITLHLMEDGQATATNSKEAEVVRLLGLTGDDNSDSNGLDTDGYKLNGAFKFTIDRDEGTASLEPTAELLLACPFNPPRPEPNNSPLESCILRRDVRGRIFPARLGAVPTAMEILAAPGSARDSTEEIIDGVAENLIETSEESAFLTTILGESDYTKELAPAFARAIHARYQLNGRYRRAYWINPGYEWTPTQTAGRSLFTVSQKIYLFALISLDENWTRRRALLQASSPLSDSSAGVGQSVFSFGVSRASMMATTFGVPEEMVVQYSVQLQLDQAMACMEPLYRQSAVRSLLAGYVEDSATAVHSVQVTTMQLDLNGLTCPSARRRGLSRSLLAEVSPATAEVGMLLVFKEVAEPQFNEAFFGEQPGVLGLTADPSNADVVKISHPDWRPVTFPPEEDDKQASSKIALIAGGAGGGVVLLGGLAYMLHRRRQSGAEEATWSPVHATTGFAELKGADLEGLGGGLGSSGGGLDASAVADLKAQLPDGFYDPDIISEPTRSTAIEF